jgi:hypothetical protein
MTGTSDSQLNRDRTYPGSMRLIAAAVGAATILGVPAIAASSSSAAPVSYTRQASGMSSVLSARNMKPGDQVTGILSHSNQSGRDADVALTVSALIDTVGPAGGRLSRALRLTVVDREANAVLYNGPVNAVGTVRLGKIPGGRSRTYQITVSFPDGGEALANESGDNAFQGSSTTIEFNLAEARR